MQAMILAAGLGTRLKPYSEYCPKPLFPIIGKPLLLCQLEQLRRSGFGPFTINAHHLHDQFVTALIHEEDVSIQLEDVILGTGGGLRLAMPKFDRGPILVMNGDIFHSYDLSEIVSRHILSGSRVSMVVHDYQRFNNVKVSPDGFIRGFRMPSTPQKNDNEHKMMAFTGIHVLDPDILREIPDGQFYDVITLYERMISSAPNEISALEMKDGFWTDIGTPADYLDLHRDILTGVLPGSLLEMFSEVDGPQKIMPDVEIGQDVSCEDWVYIGSGVKIGSNVRIARSVIWDGAVINNGATIEDRIIVS